MCVCLSLLEVAKLEEYFLKKFPTQERIVNNSTFYYTSVWMKSYVIWCRKQAFALLPISHVSSSLSWKHFKVMNQRCISSTMLCLLCCKIGCSNSSRNLQRKNLEILISNFNWTEIWRRIIKSSIENDSEWMAYSWKGRKCHHEENHCESFSLSSL